MADALIKRTRAKKALREARGAVGRLIDAAEALDPTKARGEVTSRAKWLITAIGKLEASLSMQAEAEAAGAEAAACIIGEGVAEDDPAPFPNHAEHGRA